MHNLHLGTIGWSYDFWKGNFYPQDTPSKGYLSYYARQFDTVEVDSTFYRIPTEQVVMNWNNQTPNNFVFALKFPHQITHVKMLKDEQDRTNAFLSRAKLLNKKLGPMLLQFPHNFGFEHMPDLEDYVQTLPKSNRYVIEVRNKSWLNISFYNFMESNNIALAWIDSPLRLPANEVTADFLYIRLEGDRKKVNGTLGKIESDRTADLAVWAQKIESFLEKGIEVFCYFGKYFSGFPPSDVMSLQSRLLEER